MRRTNTTLLAVVDELLTKSFPSRFVDGKEYFVIPRTYWGKLGLTPRQIDRIFEKLRKFGVIDTIVKQHEGKPTLHVHIVSQSLGVVERLCAGKNKKGENQKTHGFHQKTYWKDKPENQQSHGFHRNYRCKTMQKPVNPRFSPKPRPNINISSIERENKERYTHSQEKPKILELREKLIRVGLPEGAIKYVLRKAQTDKWLFKNLVCLVDSKYFLEDVRDRLAIVLALVRNPHCYNYLGLKAAGEEKKKANTPHQQTVTKPAKVQLQLTKEQLEQLANIRGILEKTQTKEETINFVLKKAVLNIQYLGKLIEFTKTNYFAQRVRDKTAFMIAFLDCPDRFEMPVEKGKEGLGVHKRSSYRGKKHEKVLHEERPAETYTAMEMLYKEYLKNSKEDIQQVLNELGIPSSGTTAERTCDYVDDEEDVFVFLGIPKPKSA
ncbi:hypothetical protein [Anaerocellum danielii]|uniref:Uncharacterized protein n=1 Tax=Anaerocellum danielii TaxID=1387557 RepID=A0ABZ0TZD3_9FIRM|nr:hypothetical protein [Caldicellulosiruptor danielii]WPX08222.1 hypothetical protein SOJ16_002089 [Caldicellulosiruptor danielii]